MTARSLVVGLDGADLSLVEALGPGELPVLHALMARGAYAACRSVQPPATLPNWTTFLTGVDPGVHGVFDFTLRSGYEVRFTAGSIREAPTVASRLDALGKQCACLFFPATHPPERLRHGVFISGWDAPVAFEADASFVWPRALHRRIVERFGTQRFDDANEFDAERPGWHERLPDTLCARIRRRTELSSWLLREGNWDLFAVYFGESDTAAHHLWALHDPRSPRHPRRSGLDTSGLTRVYRALDAALGELVERAGGERVEVTIVSDHGSGGSSDKVLYLNRVLADAGLLAFADPRTRERWPGLAKDAALRLLPPRTRERVFRLAGARLPSWLESRARFAGIDMARTRAFSDELNYFPAVHLNVAGREPRGTVSPAAVPRVVAEVRRALDELRDPWTGRKVVAAVHRREELFEGPHVARAPDLLLELCFDAGYSYNLMPSRGGAPEKGAWRRLSPREYLGRKGRSLPGSHRPRGLYVAAGPRVEAMGRIEVSIADATAGVLVRMGVDPGTELAGRVPAAVRASALARDTLPPVERPRHAGRREEGRVAERLRQLGYIE